MPLYVDSGISVESWVEMKRQVPARHEVDRFNELAMLFFGAQDNYVLYLGKENLRSVAELASKALAELDAEQPADADD
ncbi:MAG TPA: hypothetical protein VHX38_06645 [Pseudonocardiaceae bacterium]|jgi:hypothetical protein|nr:hypothetical protein [Pseudonocardiaceae bacterium]